MEKEGLLQYVKLANDLETELYLNRKLLSELPNSQHTQQPIEPQKPVLKNVDVPRKPTIEKPASTATINILMVVGIVGIVMFVVGCVLIFFGLSEYEDNLKVWGAIIGFLGDVVAVFSFKNYDTRKKAFEKYNQEMQKYEKRLKDYNDNIHTWKKENSEKQERYQREIETYSNKLNAYEQKCHADTQLITKAGNDVSAALEQLYAKDIIFPKYRNIVAISAIYEYLSSGRCSQLEGADGAYNLYEMELRQNIVIGQLSQIISNLEQIKNSQFTLYNEIATADNKAKEILSDINDNVRVNAYCAQTSAKSAETLKHLAFIKH